MSQGKRQVFSLLRKPGIYGSGKRVSITGKNGAKIWKQSQKERFLVKFEAWQWEDIY